MKRKKDPYERISRPPREILRKQIDRMIDFRRDNRPWDKSEIRVVAMPLTMLQALNLPRPAKGGAWPQTCQFRGYRIRCTLTQSNEPATDHERREPPGLDSLPIRGLIGEKGQEQPQSLVPARGTFAERYKHYAGREMPILDEPAPYEDD